MQYIFFFFWGEEDFVEKNIKCINLDNNEKESDDNTENELNDSVFESADENEEDQSKVENVNSDKDSLRPKTPRRSIRERKSPIRYPNNSTSTSFRNQPSGKFRHDSPKNIHVKYCRIETPCTFEEAMNIDESVNWEKAMNQEIDCIKKNKTWELMDKVKDKMVLDVKGVYTRKSDDRYEARLVVRGFQQTDGIDVIYAPVAKSQALKILFSYCCQNGLRIEQMDV